MRYKERHVARQDRPLQGKPALSQATKMGKGDSLAVAASSGLLLLFFLLHHASLKNGTHLLIVIGITLSFALLGWLTRGVNLSGAIAGGAVALVLAARDLRMFWVLLVVFGITLAATRTGRSRKRELRASEPDEGRSASQVMANLGIAALLVSIAPFGWELMAVAALAEAAADTSSSEIGMAFPGTTVLLTTWKRVRPGTDGGISFPGTCAAVLAASGVALTARLLHLAASHQTSVIIYAGVLGMLFDSLLGALLERRGYLDNDAVNLLSTAAAAGVAWLLV